jgi:Rrf2 family nitric oxide-sensitive transcriptional repressor
VQLTRFTDYALRVLMHLGQQTAGSRSQIAPLAELFHVPRTHMMKVVHHLGKAGWIDTFQGKGGGFCLGVTPEQIRLGDVIRQFEPTTQPINCQEPICPLAGNCLLFPALNRATQAFLAECNKVTLADLINKENI